MSVRDGALCAVALAILFGACEHEEMTYEDRDAMTIEDIVTPPPTNVITGPGCDDDDQCETDLCLTTQYLVDFGVESGIEVPGGLCTMLLCSADEDCGGQAACIDGSPFGAAGFQLCLPRCDEMVDCRWKEAWSCVAPLEEEPELQVCLPDNIIVAIECDDGHCEEGSQ